jgi:hypothetical protein
MADDLSLILSALNASDKAAEESNPYGFLSDTGSNVGNLMMQAAGSGKYDIGETALGSFVAGLLGGFGKNLGNSYTSKQNQLAQDYLFGGGDKPEGINDSVFKSVSKARSIFDLSRKLEAEQAQRASGQDLQKTIAGESIKGIFSNPYRAKDSLALLNEIMGGKQPTASAASQEGSLAEPASPAQNSTSAAPGSPALRLGYEDYLRKYKGDETLARDAFKTDVLDKPQKNEDRLSALRKEFQGLGEVQSFVTSDIGLKSMKKAILDPSSTSDLELVRGAIQAIEPGMAVREGEQAAVRQSGSIPSQWIAAIDGALTGKTRLPQDVREGIIRIAQRRYNEYGAKFNQSREFYMGQAQRMGLPDGVTYLEAAQLEPYQEAQQTMPLPGGLSISSPAPNIKILNGQAYEKIQGQWVRKP